MSEMHTSIHDLPGGGIMARCEQDFRDLVDEYAERIQRDVDAAALDKAAGALAEFGYVKVVRCRDCKYYHDGTNNGRRYTEPHCLAIGELAYGALFDVDENDFCSWAERKTDAQPTRLRGEGM